MNLVSLAMARAIDERAQTVFAMPELALVEAAGRACASKLVSDCPEIFSQPGQWLVLCGRGNNAADALVMLRGLIILQKITASAILMMSNQRPAVDETTPFALAFRSLEALGATWRPFTADLTTSLTAASVIIDGMAGSGLTGPLKAPYATVVASWNKVYDKRTMSTSRQPLLIAIDLPSGLADNSPPDWPIIKADFILAIEPRKFALYRLAAANFVGKIIPVDGVFPPSLLAVETKLQLADYKTAVAAIPPVASKAYKHQRGQVTIFAGAQGTYGAARLAVKGAQAAGAGLIHLYVDKDFYQGLAAAEYGAMVRAYPADLEKLLINTDVFLAGPGWGQSTDRKIMLDQIIAAEAAGAAIVLDADALRISLLKPFAGRTILTPHPAEFKALLKSVGKAAENADLEQSLLQVAAQLNAVLVYKAASVFIAAPDGRSAIFTGGIPVLATGGSGDVLSGVTAAVSARQRRLAADNDSLFDPFPSAVAAVALLREAGKIASKQTGFCDAVKFTEIIAKLAAAAWIPNQL